MKSTGGKDDPGLLRIDYSGFSGEESLEEISWDEFFAAFEDNELAFLFSPDPNSRFSKLVARATVDIEVVADDEATDARPRSATDILREDHREVEAMFERLLSDGGDRDLIVEGLKIALHVHTRIEQEVFYPAYADLSDEARRRVDEAIAEHNEVEAALEDLDDYETDDPEFAPRVREVRDSVLAHVDKEEKAIFPDAERQLDDADLERLGRELEQARDDVIARGDIAPSAQDPLESPGA